MQNNGTFQKIIRTNAKPQQDKQAPARAGKQWKREDKRNRFSQQ